MKTLRNARKNQSLQGASLIEVLFVIGAVSCIATLAYVVFANVMPTSSENKLERQVAVLNASATMYKVNGGHFDSLASTADVFQKLQSASHADEEHRVVGLAGSMVDPDLMAIPTKKQEITDTSIPRVVWDNELQKFLITYKKKAGIKSFYLDSEGSAERILGRESRLRGGAVEYAANDDWVWDYNDSPITTSGPDYIPHAGTTTGGPGTPPPPPGRLSDILMPPLISIPEGVYPITNYELNVTLANPNPEGSGEIYYSVNHGPLRRYKGEFLTFEPDEHVAAIVKPISKKWKRSVYNVAYYTASPVKLSPPIIHASAPQFDWDTNDTVHVTLDNPNGADVSSIEYSIDGTNWKTYKKSLKFKDKKYPSGVTLTARAIPTAPYYLQSDYRSRKIGPAVLAVLNPPIITFSEQNFSAEVDKIKVTLENPNPSGSSDIYYAITDPEAYRDESKAPKFKKYKKAFTGKHKDYKHGFAIIAYAKAKSSNYQDSIRRERETGFDGDVAPPSTEYPETVGLVGGHFDLDTSSFIAEFNKGTTDAHVHEYDKKYAVPGADFFNLKGGKLHNITDDVPPDAKFKLVVVNPDLSPGGRLVINQSYNDKDPSTWIPVQDYANIAVEDLPIFSFNGIPGTIQLTQFGLYFEASAIANNDIIPTNTGDVRDNVPGKNGEWRNGALTIQALAVKSNNEPDFATSRAISNGGKHGGATKGLHWEAVVFWHWDGDSYHEKGNTYEATPTLMDATILLADVDMISNGTSSILRYADEASTNADHLTNEDLATLSGNAWLRLSQSYSGREILLPTGKLGDSGLFATGSDFPHTLHELIDGGIPQGHLNNVPGVAPLSADQYSDLVGEKVVAVVHKGEISYDPATQQTDLKGDRRGLLAFTVTGIEPAGSLPESGSPDSLPVLRVRIDRSISQINPSAFGATPENPGTLPGDPAPIVDNRSFTGSTHGEFHDPTGNPIPDTNLSGSGLSNFFEWGSSADKNTLFFTGQSFQDVTNGEEFALGTLEFYNTNTGSGDETVHVKFDVNLNLDVPDLTETLGFAFDIFGTNDRGSNTAAENSDYVTFSDPTANFATQIEGQLYGLSLRFGDVAINGFSTDNQFNVYEGDTATSIIYGSFYLVDPADLAQQLVP